MPTNNFQVFAGAAGANVLTVAQYQELAALQTGFQSGIAQSDQLNTVWRQGSIIASMIAQFICDNSGQNAIDDGTIATLEKNFEAAIQAITQVKVVLPLNLYVSPSGNDSNSGLSPTSALQHIGTAVNNVFSLYNFQGNNVTINVGPGTYNEGVTIIGAPLSCPGVTILGSPSNPGSVVVTAPSTASAAFNVFNNATELTIDGLTVVNTAGSTASGTGWGILCQSGAVTLSNIAFGQCANAQCEAAQGGWVTLLGTNTFTGSNKYGVVAEVNGVVDILDCTINFLNTPNYSSQFITAANCSVVQSVGSSFNGTFTGAAFSVAFASVINTQGAGQNIYPTATAGTVSSATFGVYS